jgi:hypothetical protein
MGGDRAVFIATMTALTESDLYRYSNPVWPVSSTVPNDGPPPAKWAYSTKDSVGLYQQRPRWWGIGTTDERIVQCMDAAESTKLFVGALKYVPGWQTLDPWVAAQRVQQSEYDGETVRNGKVLGFGTNYRDRMAQAERVLDGSPLYFTNGGS